MELILTHTGRLNFTQLELVFRDAKQFTGLTHCQARNYCVRIVA